MARILIYGMNYAPEPVGVGRYSGELGAYLAASGHVVTVVTAPPHYPDWKVTPPFRAYRYAVSDEAGQRVLRCPILVRRQIAGLSRLLAPISFALSSAPVAVWEAWRRRPDTVLCVEPTFLSAPFGLLLARLVGARAVLHVQDLEIDAAFAVGHLRGERLRRWAERIERAVLRRFDLVIAISLKMQGRLQAKGVRTDRLVLLRNWVDLDQIQPLGRASRYRAELGLPKGAFVVLYAGSIGSKQALGVVLEAASDLVDEPGAVFVIAGDGPEKPKLTARYGALPNVRFLPLQPEERLNELLNLADLHVLPQLGGVADLVLPSKLGGMLASGKRILVTADRGTELHDFLDDVATVVPAGDSAAMARAIRTLLHQDRDPGPAGRAKAAASLSREACLAAFERLLSRRPGPRPAPATDPVSARGLPGPPSP
ncbi:MAG: Colanic acid biosynthesis glycosyltransferase WcaI [Enterovirga sp.]|nr:Colanic acid biosynthesis glycosyltransferase WcaI [Enterovirga sp.]